MQAVNPNKAVSRRWFQEVWNEGRVELIGELAHRDALCHNLEGPDVTTSSPEQFLDFHQRMRGAISGLHLEILDMIAEDDRVVLRIHSTGTHTGNDLGIPPTGNAIDFESIVILRFVDGKIAEGWNYLDQLSFYQQLHILNVR